MKTICQKSGVPIFKTDYLIGFDLADEHPIFKARTNLILNPEMVHRFARAESEFEKRLIYLAVLNASYLVHFEYPAAPSLKVMEKTFYQAMDLVQWVRFAEYKLAKIVAFPQYVIRKDNADLASVKAWLDSIEDLRQKINRKELERDKNAALLQREMEIKRELNEAIAIGKAFTPNLAKWSLDLCDITVRHKDYSKWMKILCCPTSEAWIFNLEDYYEIRETLQNNLPFLEDNPQAISVMHQINQLIQECRRGFTEFSIFNDSGEESVSDFEILEDGTQRQTIHKINQHMKDVPLDEPKKENYPKKLDYLMAKAKWDISQRMANPIQLASPPKIVLDEGSV